MYLHMQYNNIQCGKKHFQGTSVSITFSLFECYQLWIVKPKVSSFQIYLNCFNFKSGRSFSVVSPNMGGAG